MRLLTLTLLLLAQAGLQAADWPQFLGPLRSGAAADSEPALPASLAAEPPVLWEKKLGTGFSGPVVAGGRVIIPHRQADQIIISCLEARTGAQVWESAYTTDYVDNFGFDNGPRAVPAMDDGRVFLHGPEGRVTALDLKSGREVWAYDTAGSLGSQQGFFGRVGSPLVVGGKVIVPAGGTLNGKAAGLVALAAESGQPAWQAVDDEAGYSSPVALSGDRLLAWMRNQLWLVDARAGKVLAEMPLRSRMDASVNAATPVPCGGDTWFVSAGYGVGAHMIRVTADAAPKLEEVWTKADAMDCHYSTPVEHEGHLYGFHGRQETGQVLCCVSTVTGKRLWESQEVPGGTLVRVGGHLLVVTEQGELWVVKATPEKFETVLTTQILRAGHRSHPAYADGILYARDGEKLVAVKLR